MLCFVALHVVLRWDVLGCVVVGWGSVGIVRIQRSHSSLSMICRHIDWRHGSRKRGFQHVGFTLIVSSHLIWLTVSNPPFPQPPFYASPKDMTQISHEVMIWSVRNQVPEHVAVEKSEWTHHVSSYGMKHWTVGLPSLSI